MSVLVVFPTQAEAPVAIQAMAEFRGVLTAAFGDSVDYYIEYLDAYRFDERGYIARFRTSLRSRYAQRRFDVVVTPTSRSLNVVRGGADPLFPETPVIFLSHPGQRGGPLMTGVTSGYDMAGSLETALRIHPETARVVVVGGASEVDRGLAGEVRRQFRQFEDRVSFNYLLGRSMDELRHTLSHLPPGSLIFYVLLSEDGAGKRFIPVAALDELALVANAPIYGWHDTMLGYGTVGGLLYSHEVAMRELADLTVRILHGESPGSIPVRAIVPVVTRFDARQLQRWGISEARLPAGSVVAFKQPGVFVRYRPYVVGIGIAVVAGVLFVALWAVERHRRLHGVREAQVQFAAMTHLERRAALGELTATITHELGQPIATILRNAEAAKMILASDTPRLSALEEIVEDIRKSDRRAHELIQRLRTVLRKREVQSEVVDLNRVVEDAVKLADPVASERHTALHVEPRADGCFVSGDPVHLEQAVFNLLLNGLDAVIQTPRPRRRLTVSVCSDGSYVGVVVRDTGPGFTGDAIGRAFEPFFSTKPDGMGMGLSIVRSVVQAHGGRVAAANHDQGGAVVTVLLPRLDMGEEIHGNHAS